MTIYFLTLIWYNGAAKYIPRQSFTHLLRSLVKYSERNNVDVLRDAVLTGFAIIGRDLNNKVNEQEEEMLWDLFLSSRHSNLGVAGRYPLVVFRYEC
jgi:hypothetical protein